MVVNVVAVDPGAMCGIAIYRDGRFDSFPLARADAPNWIRGYASGLSDKPAIVMERFIFGTGRRRAVSPQRDAVEVIGALDELAEALHLDTFRQTSADAKRIATDAHLRRIGWYHSGWPHANDAARHLYLALMRHWPDEFKRVIRGETAEINRVDEEPEELRNRADSPAASGQG